jgi:hypothetical protein
MQPLRGQQPEAGSEAKSEEAEKQPTAYRLDFTINEIEDRKVVNSRQYSLNLNGGDANSLKVGTRVPVETKQGEFQYMDIGTNIWCRLRDRGGDVAGGVLSLEFRADITNFATPDHQNQSSLPPLLRQLQINGSTVVLLAKTGSLGVVDDPNPKRQFQLEVVVNKIR